MIAQLQQTVYAAVCRHDSMKGISVCAGGPLKSKTDLVAIPPRVWHHVSCFFFVLAAARWTPTATRDEIHERFHGPNPVAQQLAHAAMRFRGATHGPRQPQS